MRGGAVRRYLATKTPGSRPEAKIVLDKLAAILKAHKSHPVDLEGLRILESNERFTGVKRSVSESSNTQAIRK